MPDLVAAEEVVHIETLTELMERSPFLSRLSHETPFYISMAMPARTAMKTLTTSTWVAEAAALAKLLSTGAVPTAGKAFCGLWIPYSMALVAVAQALGTVVDMANATAAEAE